LLTLAGFYSIGLPVISLDDSFEFYAILATQDTTVYCLKYDSLEVDRSIKYSFGDETPVVIDDFS
jgi:hypothetical protein